MGGGGKSGGGGGDTTTTVRFAPYIETQHQNFLASVATARTNALNAGSPYATYNDAEIELAFFGTGYTIASFPALYDMYGKFMAGLDIEALWTQTFEDTVNSPEVGVLVAAEGAMLDADITANLLPRLQTGMRDTNSVMSSTFVIGKSLIEDARVKALSKFSAELKYRLIPVAQDRWTRHLEWNKTTVQMYAEIMKFYYSAKHDVDELNFSMAAKSALWPFTVLEYERAALGALQGAHNTTSNVPGSSSGQRVIGGALGGMAAGAMAGLALGPAAPFSVPVMAAAGGLLGGLGGLFG